MKCLIFVAIGNARADSSEVILDDKTRNRSVGLVNLNPKFISSPCRYTEHWV